MDIVTISEAKINQQKRHGGLSGIFYITDQHTQNKTFCFRIAIWSSAYIVMNHIYHIEKKGAAREVIFTWEKKLVPKHSMEQS